MTYYSQDYLFLVETGKPGREALAIYGESGVDEIDALAKLEKRFADSLNIPRRIIGWGLAKWTKPGGGGSSLHPVNFTMVPVKWEEKHEVGFGYLKRGDLAE